VNLGFRLSCCPDSQLFGGIPLEFCFLIIFLDFHNNVSDFCGHVLIR
jgi:hypothetical protein